MAKTALAKKTIDIRGLGHAEKEKLVFPNIDSLEPGDTLRVIAEFNPVPLTYVLKAQNAFDISYEKEGPAEWILNVVRTAPREDKKGQFKELLKELKSGDVSAESKEKAKKLLQSVDANTLGALEQELIREGVSHDEIRASLCDIHLEVLRDSLVAKQIKVSAPHPVHTFMEEHKIIVNSLTELGGIIDRIKTKESLQDVGPDLERLKDISHHLVEAENHHRREEEVLFPALEKRDIVEPPEIMKLDHVEFRKRKHALYEVAHHPDERDFAGFKAKVIEYGQYLTEQLESHIFKEDNILYQIALQVISEAEWEEIRRGCDKIGYCCFTPDELKPAKVVELELRTMPPFERHERILKEWDALKHGETLKITNDHDPKPLHYQFEAEYKGQYEWKYEKTEPREWVVTIKKV